MPTERRGLQARLKGIYETDLEKFLPMTVASGRLSKADGQSIAIFDRKNYVMEIIQQDGEGKWGSALHFVLFEENPHYRGRRSAEFQPRECLISDVNGDGADDLILLMHDRVLVYPQR